MTIASRSALAALSDEDEPRLNDQIWTRRIMKLPGCERKLSRRWDWTSTGALGGRGAWVQVLQIAREQGTLPNPVRQVFG